MGFLEALTVVFIVLKLVGILDWSWWWVMSPLIGSVVALVIGSGIFVYLSRK